MRWLKTRWLGLAGLPLAMLVLLTVADGQSLDPAADLASRINLERTNRGLPPYALSKQLTASAQAHAEDIARTGNYGHIGSDGSTVFDRTARSGFGAYSWGRRVGENWAWYRSAADAMALWMSDAPHRNNILHPLYREMGIGVVPTKPANILFVVDFGAEPDVLPVFIDGGVGVTRDVTATLTLTNENVTPAGDGPNNIGRATTVQISNTSSFEGAAWQPFAATVPWKLPAGNGTKTVYVRFKDTQGRTVVSSDSIDLSDAGMPAARPTATATRRPRPTPTSTPTATPTASVAPSDTPTATVTASAAAVTSPTGTSSPTSTPTVTPIVADVTHDPGSLAGGALGLAAMAAALACARYLSRRI